MNFKRVFHHYEKWEEYHNGMWKIMHGEQRREMLVVVENFMRDTDRFREAMFIAISTWTYSCEDKLTCRSLNKLAWIGHAACCISVGSPEEVTRSAWWNLTEDEQCRANAAASEALIAWNRLYSLKLRGIDAKA